MLKTRDVEIWKRDYKLIPGQLYVAFCPICICDDCNLNENAFLANNILVFSHDILILVFCIGLRWLYVKLSHCLSITADKKPEILNKNQTIVVQKGDQAVLHCNATGSPSPGFTWEKTSTCPGYHRNGQPLVLNNVTMSVAGTYKCIATNSLGRDESDFTLVVNGKFGYFSVKKRKTWGFSTVYFAVSFLS